jgi:hypothetical protein
MSPLSIHEKKNQRTRICHSFAWFVLENDGGTAKTMVAGIARFAIAAAAEAAARQEAERQEAQQEESRHIARQREMLRKQKPMTVRIRSLRGLLEAFHMPWDCFSCLYVGCLC